MSEESQLIDAVIAERGFAVQFSAKVLQSANDNAQNPQEAKTRTDKRKTPFVTIDGQTARDFDDAVFCTRHNNGFCLQVAIADVASYVPFNSPLDIEARRRAVSLYFPDRVLPMLPAVLSDDVCSLNPDEDKLSLMCEMIIENGVIQKYDFVRAVVRSQRRLTYQDAYAAMQNKSDEMLCLLHELALQLRATRLQDGAFVMSRNEQTLSEEESIRNDAHKAIEECMLAANRCAADFVIRRRLPALHRIHKKPAADGIQRLRLVLQPLGVAVPKRPSAHDFSQIIEVLDAKDPQLTNCLLPVVLGALSRAEYAPDTKTGHFGLACSRYLHFTSPIRRYPDLIAHRAIIAGLEKSTPPALDLKLIGEHCSQSEVVADKAGWECERRLLCWRARDAVGREFEAYMSGGMRHGMFVNIPALGIDGMVLAASLSGYWRYNDSLCQFSENGGQVLSLGTPLTVRLISVNPNKGRADCALLSINEAAR